MAEKNLSLNISGMTCAACSSRVERVLNKMDDVEAQVNLATESARVTYDDQSIKPDDIVEKIQKIGYDVEIEREDFDITGMTCAACSNRIERVLQKMPGVDQAAVNLTTETATVSYYTGMIDDADIVRKVKELGYEATAQQSKEEKQSNKEKELKKMQNKLIISAVLRSEERRVGK